MARRTWYRLDNIGKFYSSQAGRSSQTVFRYSEKGMAWNNGNVYADHNGNVYEHNDNGWQQHTSSGWQPVQPAPQAHAVLPQVWRDGAGAVWHQLDLQRLAQAPGFLNPHQPPDPRNADV